MVAAVCAAAPSAKAALTWDANGTGSGQTDGTGAWLGANQWWDSAASANTTWVSGSDAIFGNGAAGAAVTLASPTTVNTITFNTFTGTYTLGTAGQTLTINGGLTMNSGSGNVTFASPVAIGGSQNWTNNDDSPLTLGTVTNGSASSTYTITVNGSGTGGTTFGNAVSDNGSGKLAIIVNTTGGTTMLGSTAAANTFTGGTTLTAGVLKVGSATSFGGAGGAINVSGGTLEASTGQNFTNPYLLNLNSDLAVGAASNTARILFGGVYTSTTTGTSIDVENGTRTLTLYQGNSTIGMNNAQLGIGSSGTSTNAVNSTGGAGTLRIAGGGGASATAPGILYVNGALTFASGVGFTIGSNATTIFSSNTAAGLSGSVALTIESGGALNLSDNSATATSKNISVGTLAGAGKVVNSAATAGTATLTINGAGSTLFSGSIQDGGYNSTTLGKVALTIAKSSGTQTLSGTNTYTGATSVTGGTLLVGQAGAGSITSAVSVSAGTFGGSGSSSASVAIGDGTLTSGNRDSFLAPGNDGTGTFTTTSTLSLQSDATYNFELNSTTGAADKVVANGVTINPSALFSFTDLGSGSGVVDGETFLVIDNTSASALTPFSNLAQGGTLVSHGVTYTASYLGGVGGNDLVLTASVPEPGCIAIMTIASAAVLRRRRGAMA